jgi:hypothetical protein
VSSFSRNLFSVGHGVDGASVPSAIGLEGEGRFGDLTGRSGDTASRAISSCCVCVTLIRIHHK